ncbi:hypothetical protein PV677_36145 [Streptomyces sp. DE06-01C]|uniref:hypothetical protein n=1 Tax=Streptomyces sp. DE06-01C TaxID=3028656 RepID=UPI0029C1D26C|nr:hypothetical protein [Streptomyces sp. DE06-01C]MDX5526103.1 hypothetical protein [Streptomyces sp. DE06-01C]
MNTTGIRRLGQALRTILNWTLATCTVLFFAGLGTIAILGNTVWKNDNKPAPAATVSATATPRAVPSGTPIQWRYIGQACADGWPSTSIGKRGACSHHGGVVTVYQSTPGDLTTQCHPYGHPKTLERAQQLAGTTRTVPCDFPDDE